MAVLPPDPLFVLKENMGFIHCLCFPPPVGGYSPNRLLAGTDAGFLYIWNIDNNRLQYRFEVGTSLICICHTDEMMITQEKLRKLKIWQRENECEYKQTGEINTSLSFCRTVLFQNQCIAVPQENSTIELYNFKTQTKILSFEPSSDDKLGNVMCLNYVNFNGNDYILAGYESGDTLLWDIRNSTTYLSRLKLREYLTSIDFDTLNNRGVAGNASNYLQVFSIDKALNISLKRELMMTNAGCNVVKIRNDRKVFVSGGWDGYLRIYSWKSLRPLAVLTEHKGPLNDITFSERPVTTWNANLMAAAGQDGLITLWDLYNN